MKNKLTLYLDQFGNHFFAYTVRELRAFIGNGGSRVSKVYQDRDDGSVVHIGYLIGQHLLTAFQPVEIPQR